MHNMFADPKGFSPHNFSGLYIPPPPWLYSYAVGIKKPSSTIIVDKEYTMLYASPHVADMFTRPVICMNPRIEFVPMFGDPSNTISPDLVLERVGNCALVFNKKLLTYDVQGLLKELSMLDDALTTDFIDAIIPHASDTGHWEFVLDWADYKNKNNLFKSIEERFAL